MLTIRKSGERGHADHGWLQARHTFSFANYFDPRHLGYRSLRVINEDRVAPARGFGRHPHENMEIFTYVVSGSLAHADSMGSQRTIGPGVVQYMSAGSGVLHSEFNASKTDPVHLLQIWIEPDVMDAEPRYEDRDFGAALATGRPVLILSPDGREGSFGIRQDVLVIAARPQAGSTIEHPLRDGRVGWVQVIKGNPTVNGVVLEPGDGLAIENESSIRLEATTDSEVLLFDLA